MQRTTKNDFLNRYGPWALIAGASEGLGAAFAESLAARKMNLVLIARRAELLQERAHQFTRRYGVNALPLPLDLSHPEALDELIQGTSTLEIGLLIYNAGFSVEGPFLAHPLEEHLEELRTNIDMLLRLIYHFGSRMLSSRHGGIVLMASLSAFQGSAYISNYSATKAYALILAESLWEEWRRQGVDVLACAAGAVRTPNYESSRPHHTGRLSGAPMEPEKVVQETLAALGRGPIVIPGRMNRLSSIVMRRFFTRRAAIRVMGSVLKDMYGPDPKDQKGEQ